MTEDRFRVLTEAAPIGMFECDDNGNCRYTNPTWSAITGIPTEEALGTGWQRMLHPDDADAMLRDWYAAQAAMRTYEGRFRIAVPNGATRWADARAVPTVVDDAVSGWVGTLVDVSASLEAERATTLARDRALEAARLKSDFVANISHEIRTPLNAVLGLAEILADTRLDEKQLSYVSTLRRAGNDLLGLLNDVLDLSKIEAGAMRLECAPFDLEEAVRATAELFAPSARAKALDFDVRINPSIAPRLLGDWPRLRQVVSNLLSNAIKFTDSGRVVLRVTTLPTATGGVQLHIDVEDSGPGIDPADQSRVFDVFGQADSSSKRRNGGSGLGLSISRQILAMMNGTLSLTSTVGVGSTFCVRVNLAVAVAGCDASEPVLPVDAAPLGFHVLVIEDNAVNQLVLETLLRAQGCEVDVADNGEVGARRAAEVAYDLIFMDCQMPVMDGFEATAAIRAMPAPHGAVPIVALTASAMPADRERCLAAGMDEYLSKPVTKTALLEFLQRCPQFQGGAK